MTRSDSPRPGDESEKDRDPPSQPHAQPPAQTPAEPLPEEDLEQVEEQPS